MKRSIHELVTSCRIKPALKMHFRLVRSVKASIAIEQGATEVQPNLLGHLLQRLQALMQHQAVSSTGATGTGANTEL